MTLTFSERGDADALPANGTYPDTCPDIPSRPLPQCPWLTLTSLSPAVDAVYALAHALHNMLVARCGGVTLCKEVQPVPDGQQLLRHIRNVSFIGE